MSRLTRALGWRRKNEPRRLFTGTWEHRLHGVMTCGVDFSGRSVLDVGCNMGIIAYEVAKDRPAFIHGLDRDRRSVAIAREIFRAIPIESRFEQFELTNTRQFDAVLKPRYDIVLYLSVYIHLCDQIGVERSDAISRLLLDRTGEVLIARTGRGRETHFRELVEAAGFVLTAKVESLQGLGSHLSAFRRTTPVSAAI